MKANINFKKVLFSLVFILSYTYINALSVSITSAAFKNKNTKYLEVYIQVIGETVDFSVLEENKMQANVDFILYLKKDNKIISFDKFALQSPVSSFKKDFIGIRRIKIDTGKYILEVSAVDKLNSQNKFIYRKDISIELKDNEFCFSDIQLLADVKKDDNTQNPFVKNGYYLEPALSYFFPKKVNNLGIYFEVYNVEEPLEGMDLKIVLNKGYKGTKLKELLHQDFKLNSKIINPILTKIDISGLASGNYHIETQLWNNGKLTHTKFVNFQRSNPVSAVTKNNKKTGYENSFATKIPKDSLFYSLKAMVPLTTASNSIAINNIIAKKKIKEARYFLWRYWYEFNNSSPEKSYREFMKYAIAVDKTYKSHLGYGFETDRGIVFLKYGKPSQIITQPSEPSAPPYEIWYYDIIDQGKQRNIKFLFYIPSLAHNDYQLLHSNCRGERNNPTWFYKLYSKRTDINTKSTKQSEVEDFYNTLKNSFNSNAVKIWEEL